MKKLLGAAMIGCMLTGTVFAQEFIFRRSLTSIPQIPPATDTGEQVSGEPDTGEPDLGEEEDEVAEVCDTTPVVASSGLYSPPSGCSRIQVQAWGGGGKGASCRPSMLTDTCYGGGGGAYISVIVTLDTSRSYLVEVGSGGKGLVDADGGSTVLRDGPSWLNSVLVEAPGGYAGDHHRYPGKGGGVDFFDPTGSAPWPIKGGSGGGKYESYYPVALYVGGGGGGAGRTGYGNNGNKGGPSGHGTGGSGGPGGGGRGGNGGPTGGDGQEPGGGGGAGLDTGGGGGNGAKGRMILTPIE